MHINPMRAGMAVGGFAAIMHIIWAALVAFGWAQGLLDFIFTAHMIRPAYQVLEFNFASALMLIVVVAVVGYIVGFIFAQVWNRVGKEA